MSSTNRGGKRTKADNYPTPKFCVLRLLERIDPHRQRWGGQFAFEPCAGEGAIIAAANEFYKGSERAPTWVSNELRKDAKLVLSRHVPPSHQNFGDYLDRDRSFQGGTCAHINPGMLISNPPFNIAYEVIQRSLHFREADIYMLLRLNFLASVKRAKFMNEFPPDVYVLPNRPDFKAHGKTDSIEYAWFRWPAGKRRRAAGAVQALDTTPLAERRVNFSEIIHPKCAKDQHDIELDPKDGWCCIRPGCGYIQGAAA